MKKFLMSAAVLALALASCQNEEIVSQADGMVSVKAVMGNGSRTAVSEGGDVTWSKGDKMLVYGGETEGVLTLEGNGGSEEGIFTGFVQGSVSELTTALYPAEMASSDGTITLSQVTYPNSNSPMVAKWSTGTMQFSHLAGMLRISVTGLPNKTNTLKVSGTGIAGTAALSNGKLTDFSTDNEIIVVKGIPTGDQVIDVPVFATERLKEVTLKVSVNNGTAKEIKAAIGIGAIQCVYLNLGADGDLAETDTYTGWYDENKTEFTLRTAEELKGLADLVNGNNNFAGKTITLNNDIDLEGVEWTPIGKGNSNYDQPFCGTFDGNNKVIKNLDYEQQNTKCVGLIGHMRDGGVVKNVVLENVNISGLCHVAAVVGYAYRNTTIENCKVVDGTIIANPTGSNEGHNVGAIVGMSQGSILNCEVENVVVKGYCQIGGIVGYAQVGRVEGNSIKKSLAIRDMTVKGADKSLVVDEVGHITGATDVDNVVENVIVLDGVTSASETYPNLLKDTEGEYHIYSVEGLMDFRKYSANTDPNVFYGETFNLDADIDADGATWINVRKIVNSHENEGILINGKGHTISNLTISGAGLFSGYAGGNDATRTGEVKDITFDNVNVVGSNWFAGVVWGQLSDDIKLTNVHVLNSKVSGVNNVGGIIGATGEGNDVKGYAVTFEDCSVEGCTITASGAEGQDPTGASGFMGRALGKTIIKFEGENKVINNTIVNKNGLVGGQTFAYTIWKDGSFSSTGMSDTFTDWNGI